VVSVHIAVMCARRHSFKRVTWKIISAYIVVSVHIAVMYVIRHSFKRVIK